LNSLSAHTRLIAHRHLPRLQAACLAVRGKRRHRHPRYRRHVHQGPLASSGLERRTMRVNP